MKTIILANFEISIFLNYIVHVLKECEVFDIDIDFVFVKCVDSSSDL